MPRHPARGLLAITAVVAVTLGALFTTSQLSADEAGDVATLVNSERAWNGRPQLLVDPQLTAQAELQAGRVAACACLWHSPPGEQGWYLNQGWRWYGENAAVAGSVWQAHIALMRSPGHLANILQPGSKGVGVGVVRAHGLVWIVQVFGGY